MVKKLMTACALTALLASPMAFAAADQAAAEAAIAAAKEAHKEAKAVSGEWRDTGKMMKKAEEALAAGEFDEAVKMAEKAKFQYEAGAAQMTAQKGTGNPSFLK